MSFIFRRAIREDLPDIYGLAGPSKSGKTYSALRLAAGLANGGKIAMINTEGNRGNRYADKFDYDVVNLEEPFSMKRYEEATKAAKAISPAVLIIDSVSHAHEGVGGMLDQHETILDRIAGKDYEKRHKMTWSAWIEPKADEARMINAMLQMDCFIILCFRAKEKLKIERGKDPISLGWQPIASDRIHYETAFTLILPPGSKGTPDMSANGSELREPYDTIVTNKQIDEELGRKLAEWAIGKKNKKAPATEPDLDAQIEYDNLLTHLKTTLSGCSDVDGLKKWKEEFLTVKDKLTEQDQVALKRVLMDSAEAMKKA
jgi:hypothetical protein